MVNKFNNLEENILFRIRILSNSGDKIYLKFPVEFVKRMIKINGLNWLNLKSDIVDTENLSKVVTHALDSNLTGDIAHIQTKNKDSIKITIS
ncbi:hypothetical protein [Paraclostridium tenue]|uniref:Uncharacterized protein n=1 Tax=Paraclostridium tenue TaxID=1737 RepID=A0ABP3XBS2_9FIRM